MLEELTFRLLLHAHEELHLQAQAFTFLTGGEYRICRRDPATGKRLPSLSAGEEIIVKMELQFNVQPGQYTFSLGTSEPSPEQNPNVGFIQDRHELLGPIMVTADTEKILPFYGIARLPMKVDVCKVLRTRTEEDCEHSKNSLAVYRARRRQYWRCGLHHQDGL